MATGYDQLTGDDEPEEAFEEDGALTPHRIRLIQASWQKVRALGSEAVGVILFKNIFTIAPSALQLFTFRNRKDLYNSPFLKEHGSKVVDAVGAAVDGLNDLEALVKMLTQLGKFHVPRGVQPEHYPVVG